MLAQIRTAVTFAPMPCIVNLQPLESGMIDESFINAVLAKYLDEMRSDPDARPSDMFDSEECGWLMHFLGRTIANPRPHFRLQDDDRLFRLCSDGEIIVMQPDGDAATGESVGFVHDPYTWLELMDEHASYAYGECEDFFGPDGPFPNRVLSVFVELCDHIIPATPGIL